MSRSGRPDLVGGRLALVRVPTLLIVGAADTMVLDLNQRARTVREPAPRRSRRHHLFPEAGALSQVTDLAVGWFGRHLARTAAIAPAA